MIKKLTFLKKSLLGILLMTLFSFSASAQWTAVGAPNFTAGNVGYKIVQVYKDTVYVAFADATNTSYLSVMKYDGTSWTLVGQPGFSGVQTYDNSLDFKINSAGELYIAHTNTAGSGGVTVKKYTNGAWANVGSANLSNGQASNPNLAFDSTGVPYVAYYYSENVPTSAEISVRKFDGASWTAVGAAIGTTSNGFQLPNYPDIEFDENGKLYVAYAVGLAPKFQEFDGSSWNALGTLTGLGSGINQKIIFDSNQMPYILFNMNGGSASAQETMLITPITSIGGTWENVGGTAIVGELGATNPSVAIDDNDILYVTQVERSPLDGTFGTSIYTYDGMNWSWFGNSVFRTGLTSQSNTVISDNVLYIAFQDTSGKATVEKYDLTVGINQIATLNKEITIYPNPTKEQLTIEGVDQIESIRILTMDGKIMQTITTNSNTISVEALPQGIYTIEVITSKGTGYKNFVKQ